MQLPRPWGAESERTLLNDQRTAAQILGQRLQATVQLIKALGGGWEPTKAKPR